MFICPFVMTCQLGLAVNFPGDVDVLVVPYQDDHLWLDRALAIEVKVIRASFTKQGRSPNEFGVSQAKALLQAGFPYVAVLHLIVSDPSPRLAWRPTDAFRIIDDEGNAELLPIEDKDLLPRDLTERAFGRLKHLREGELFGVAAAYINDFYDKSRRDMLWHPECAAAEANRNVDGILLAKIAEFFENNTDRFLDNPRYDRA